jgi:hypothetical protein
VSRRTMGRLKGTPEYPFEQVSSKKFKLPLSKLPAEYSQKYQRHI